MAVAALLALVASLQAVPSHSGMLESQVALAKSYEEGTATLIPDHVSVLEWTSLQLVYEVGSSGIAAGGGIQVQFPKSWHPWTPTPLAPQTTDPTAAYYVTAQTSQPEASVTISIANAAIDGRTDLLDWTATLTLTGSSLAPGDLITYTFGDQSQGGAGVKATATAMVETVRVATDPDADGLFVELLNPPDLRLTAREPCRLAVYVPSQTKPDTSFQLYVTAQDLFTNLADTYTGTISFEATDPMAELPPPYTFIPADCGRQVFTLTLHTTGTHWITVTDGLLAPGGQASNPTDCTADAAGPKIYWGDLHSHTEFSNDGVGPLPQAMSRMRDQLRLDFYTVTDHIGNPTTGLMPDEWQTTRDLVEAYYLPDRFVTVLAYEWSMPTPYGHHNVYFEGTNGPLCYLGGCNTGYNTLEKLWRTLESEAALTIPHHTGIRWVRGEHTADWSYNRPEFRTSIEIYSLHGQSELYDPSHPLSYESRRPGAAWSVDGPHYARDAWAAGHRVGVVAGSDDHCVQPGIPWNGLTAIYADSLTRTGLFDAIRARHTYATTGERILVDFHLDEAMMGDVVRLSPSMAPTFGVRVVGTAAVDWVEMVRFDGLSYTVVYSATPSPGADPRQVGFSFTDAAMPGDSLYYLRVQQVDPNRPDWPAMAWSSPIWIEQGTVLYLPLVHRQYSSASPGK